MPEALINSLLLSAALLACIAGQAWLALTMDAHWKQVRGAPLPTVATTRTLRALGVAALALSLALCLIVDHPSMASLVWVMTLAAATLLVTFTLSWRPALLAPLVSWVRISA
ncbi:MAG: DUF3325 family protein [Rhodocyclaceae bacterium]